MKFEANKKEARNNNTNTNKTKRGKRLQDVLMKM
jgi:hypothetical protein